MEYSLGVYLVYALKSIRIKLKYLSFKWKHQKKSKYKLFLHKDFSNLLLDF